jgi:hypothetical protein
MFSADAELDCYHGRQAISDDFGKELPGDATVEQQGVRVARSSAIGKHLKCTAMLGANSLARHGQQPSGDAPRNPSLLPIDARLKCRLAGRG